MCDVDEAVAKSIVELRDGPHGLHVVDDVFTQTDTPVAAWDRIRDRAVIVPNGEPV